MRVFLTGITGFAGSHLAERFLADGDSVDGLAHESPPHRNLAAVAARIRIHAGDLEDRAALDEALEAARPDVVVHLAAQAVPTHAAADPLGTVRLNVLGTAVLLESLAARPGARLVYASSADVYGAPESIPVGEDVAPRPRNVYAATKAAAEALVREFGDRGRNPTVILRAANQNGPRQSPELAASGFARQIALAEVGLGPPVLRHGRLDGRRDFVDVRDMAAAYAAAASLSPEVTETYNVGTGRAVSISEVLAVLVGIARLEIRTELDPQRVRRGEPTELALDASRFRERTGWRPTISLEESLADTLGYWRAQTAREAAGAVGPRAARAERMDG
ncbi:MAG: GDP-mannose 4,6-dehydratase [Candidatus Limnocylindria bacterium]